jgi:hypothetical protein
LILEVLIALALVALLAVPLLRPHLTRQERHAEVMRDLQLEMIALDTLQHARLLLFDHEIEWKELDRHVSITKEIAPATLELPNGTTREIPRTIIFKEKHRHDKSDRATFRLLKVKTYLDGEKYKFYLYEEREIHHAA